ncbi:hypothetical protein Tco_0939333 [Tanacetum coccineum]|uniref:Retrovirus-related Pol polyprotein from transposon TNT 1-94 n=1 Tax=Tanacetum coccineum TaxID=301880 RepID=A0ABQ5DLI3_9ASTR
MHFLLSSMSVVYVLTTPMSEDGGDNPTVDQNVETSKELWDTLEAKYMAEGASSKKFLRTKHINVRYHFIREIVESKKIEVAKIGTKNNAADAFTKVVPGPKFKYCMQILGVGIN